MYEYTSPPPINVPALRLKAFLMFVFIPECKDAKNECGVICKTGRRCFEIHLLDNNAGIPFFGLRASLSAIVRLYFT